MPLESTIQNNVLRYLNSLPNCVAENVSGNSHQSGRPDINGCINGRSLRIELKSPDHGNKATKKQLLNLKKWGKAGAITGVCYSVDEVKELLRKAGELE
jgi:hypothetical protein